MKHIIIKVSGKVQGVFFRATAKAKADELGIKGFVRNQSDKSVYAEAEGNDEQLNEFIAWCQQGPRLAHVERCEVEEGKGAGFIEFTIQR